MIRVANIIEEAKLGGPQIRIANVAHALKGQVETTVILPRQNSDRFRKKLDTLDVPYETIRLSRITKELTAALCYMLFSVFEMIHLVRYLRKEKFDLIHVSGGSWQYKGVIAGVMSKTKVIWHLNDTRMPWLFQKIFNLLSGLPDAYIFSSERTRNYYSLLIRKDKKEYVIPAPVDTAVFTPEYINSSDDNVKSKWDGKIVIGTTANINPYKGLETLIRVATKMKENGLNPIFIVVGEIHKNQKKYYDALLSLKNELLADNIYFVGGHDDIRPFLCRFDIYVCCSPAESSPISVWEAMAMAKPIVSTNVGDVPLYVRNEHNGYIVDVGDSETLVKCLSELAQNKEKRYEYGQRSRLIAVEKLARWPRITGLQSRKMARWPILGHKVF